MREWQSDTRLESEFQVLFSADETAFRQFTSLLDTPLLPDAGLQRLISVESPWTSIRVPRHAGHRGSPHTSP